MKVIFLLTISIFTGLNMLFASNKIEQNLSSTPAMNSISDNNFGSLSGGGNTVQVINSLDSIFFDLSAAVVNGNTVEFPVYFRSDDVINALDFAFKYDHTKLDYDTTFIMENYIDAVSFYNPNDSTVRLTSYCFTQGYENDSILFIVKFTVLSGQICSGDLNTVNSWLNGDACSSHVVECLNSGISETESDLNISYFPNPATDFVIFEFEKIDRIEIVDITGKVVFQDSELSQLNFVKVDVSQLTSGIYFTRCIKGRSIKTGKLIVD